MEISVSTGLRMIMAISVPKTLMMPENSCVMDEDSALETLSTSLVRRDMMSPEEWLSKYFSGSLLSAANRSFLSLKEVCCDTVIMLMFCR